jgi:hypothetical protein
MSTPDEADLTAAIRRAKAAFMDLFGLMITHRLDFRALGLLLAMPPVIAAAYETYEARVNDVALILAAQQDIPPGTRLSDADRERLTRIAAEAVLS